MDFLEIFTSGRYQRDMKILKIFASNSKQFRVYGILKKLQFDDDKGRCDRQIQKFHRKLNPIQGAKGKKPPLLPVFPM